MPDHRIADRAGPRIARLRQQPHDNLMVGHKPQGYILALDGQRRYTFVPHERRSLANSAPERERQTGLRHHISDNHLMIFHSSPKRLLPVIVTPKEQPSLLGSKTPKPATSHSQILNLKIIFAR